LEKVGEKKKGNLIRIISLGVKRGGQNPFLFRGLKRRGAVPVVGTQGYSADDTDGLRHGLQKHGTRPGRNCFEKNRRFLLKRGSPEVLIRG